MAINEGYANYIQNLIGGYGAESPLGSALGGYLESGDIPAGLDFYLNKMYLMGKQPKQKKVAKKVAKSQAGWGVDIPETFSPPFTEDYINQFAPTPENQSALHQAIMNDIMASMQPFQEYINPVLNKMSAQGILSSSVTADALRGVASDLQRQYMEQSAKARMMEPEWLNSLWQTYIQGQYLPYTLYQALAG